MRLLDKLMVPPGLWSVTLPETGFPATGGDFNDLVKSVAKHYSGNDIRCEDPAARTEELLCRRLSDAGHVKFVMPDPPPPLVHKDYKVKQPTLTIAYMTNRKDCRFEWFWESLGTQMDGAVPIRVIIVDCYAPRKFPCIQQFHLDLGTVKHVAPKPNVWSGPHRLTKVDYFSAASARNTALCLAETTHIAFVDDLSVLCPGWLASVEQAMREGYIGLGCYRKVKNLVVKDGKIESYDDHPSGTDNRLSHVDRDVTSCAGNWLFGCSFVAPVEALLDVGGSPEMCDSTGLGSEDYCLGIALANRGNQFRYDRRMMTLESEELHHAPGQPQVKRMDKGTSPNDKSHAMLAHAQAATYYPNYYPGGIRALREFVQTKGPFPIPTEPTVDWYDGQPLSEL